MPNTTGHGASSSSPRSSRQRLLERARAVLYSLQNRETILELYADPVRMRQRLLERARAFLAETVDGGHTERLWYVRQAILREADALEAEAARGLTPSETLEELEALRIRTDAALERMPALEAGQEEQGEARSLLRLLLELDSAHLQRVALVAQELEELSGCLPERWLELEAGDRIQRIRALLGRRGFEEGAR